MGPVDRLIYMSYGAGVMVLALGSLYKLWKTHYAWFGIPMVAGAMALFLILSSLVTYPDSYPIFSSSRLWLFGGMIAYLFVALAYRRSLKASV